MCGIRVLLIQTCIGLGTLTGEDGADSATDSGDGVGDPPSSNDIASDLRCMQNNLLFNSDDVLYSRFVDRDRY
jgi:hypothetical protein